MKLSPFLAALCLAAAAGLPALADDAESAPRAAKSAAGAAQKGYPAGAPPFEITEDRPRCANYDPNRQALFGTTHLHTGLSFDASIRFVDYASGNTPRGA